MSIAESTTESETDPVTKDKLMEDLRVVVADAEELMRATANQTGERIAAARAKAGESLKTAKTRLSEVQASVIEKTKAGAKTTDDYVYANPWKVVGIAAMVGVLVGALISRR